MNEQIKNVIAEGKELWEGMDQTQRGLIFQLALAPVSAYLLRRKLRKMEAPKWAVYGLSLIAFRQILHHTEQRLYQTLQQERLDEIEEQVKPKDKPEWKPGYRGGLN